VVSSVERRLIKWRLASQRHRLRKIGVTWSRQPTWWAACSSAPAIRLGFTFEGVWRQANVYKGRNRDTAWFSILDSESPAIKTAFEHWLAPENFDAEGRQRMRLSQLTATARGA
jgi:hypothetical protein